MQRNPTSIRVRSVGEWELTSGQTYANPFVDVVVEVTFTSPSGEAAIVPAFYDGEGTWRVRFNPDQVGSWTWAVLSRPRDPELERQGSFEVTCCGERGFLRAVPGSAWGLRYESGEPCFLLGDTTYNLFGMAHCGVDVYSFLERRARQGFNLFRVRVPVSPFHPPEGYNQWQTRRTWPWGGSEQSPRFDRFNLDYFKTVDQVVEKAESLGLGLEMIMEAWGFEFPFRCRDLFVPEWEELWMRYLIARYDAYNCVYFWTLMNEYEYYPDGDWRYNPVADRWAIRMARVVKGMAPHGHIVAVHNGPRVPPFAQRFATDLHAVDAILYQTWGSRDAEYGWLAADLEQDVHRSLAGWPGVAVMAEWGYERNPEFELLLPSHEFCDEEHTRRGAWRGAFCALGIIHGFENSWGPWAHLHEDQAGLPYLLLVNRFFTQVVPFDQLAPAAELVVPAEWELGEQPLALATANHSIITVYLPVGGQVALALPQGVAEYQGEWFDPLSGERTPAVAEGASFAAPEQTHKGHPQDWVLVLRRL